MENLMSRCTNETTQTTMNTALTTTFSIYNLQREQPIYRIKTKTCISLSTNETTQTTIFPIDNKNALALKVTHTTIFS